MRLAALAAVVAVVAVAAVAAVCANVAFGVAVNSCRGASTVYPLASEQSSPASCLTSISKNCFCPVNTPPKSNDTPKRPAFTARLSEQSVLPICVPPVAASYRR